MLVTLQKAIEAACFSGRLYQLLINKVNGEKWRQRLKMFFAHEQEHYQLFQYMHLLVSGKYYKHQISERTYDSEVDIIHAALLSEVKKAEWHHQLLMDLSGAQRKAAAQALQHSLEHASAFFEMLEDVNTEENRLARKTRE